MAKSEILSKFVLSWETDKYTNKKSDRGHSTKYGITLATWKKVGYDKNGDGKIDANDVKLLTKADYDRVFKRNLWDVCHADDIKSQAIANLLVDFAYNSGAGNAIRQIQKILKVKADGIIGAKTLSAINTYKLGYWTLFDKLKVARIAFLNNIVKTDAKQEVNLKGWMRRIANIQYRQLVCNNGEKIVF